jgi:hypothetical protein
MIAENSRVTKRRLTSRFIALKRLLLRMMNQFVTFHFMRENHHRTFIANYSLRIRFMLVEQSNMPQNMILHLLAIVELCAAFIAGEKLLSMRVEMK